MQNCPKGERLTLTEGTKRTVGATVGLTPARVDALASLPLAVERIATEDEDGLASMARRIEVMNTYGDDPDVQHVEPEATAEYYRWLLSPDYLAGDGLILTMNGRDVAFALMYPVSRERNGRNGLRAGLPSYFRDCHLRADWPDIARFLRTDVPGADIDRLFHLDDYATPEQRDRRQGFGRFILRLSSDAVLPSGTIRVGFIEPTHSDSLLASVQSGSVLGRYQPNSADGEHPSFLSFYDPNLKPSFDPGSPGNVLMSADEARQSLPEFVTVLRRTLDAGHKVGFNNSTRNYEKIKAIQGRQ